MFGSYTFAWWIQTTWCFFFPNTCKPWDTHNFRGGIDYSFFTYLPTFPVSMRVPPCNDNKAGKSVDQIPNPPLHPPSTFHDSDLVEETPKWITKPRVKVNPLIPQDDISTLNNNIEYGSIESVTSSRDIFHPPSSTCYDSRYHDFLDQSTPPTSFSCSLNFQLLVQIGIRYKVVTLYW